MALCNTLHPERGGLHVVHLGRTDFQVKIRGYRIELSEIEGALRLHPHVSEAVVLALPGTRGGFELAAFCTGTPTDSRALRNALTQTLPRCMTPHRITWVKDFPLSDNGKIDRLAMRNSFV